MKEFVLLYGRTPDVVARAPGRVNLIGEHTDYNQGLVLPMPLARHAMVAIATRDDAHVEVASLDLGPGPVVRGFELGSERQMYDWPDYIQGVTCALRERELSLRGFDACVTTTVPIGGGLSSSAALTVALLRALRQAFDLPLDDLQVALLAQQAETDFVGARVGVMDPMVASLGMEGHALFIDTHDLSHRHVRIPPSFDMVVIDSGIVHRHAGGEYNRRREECERAAQMLGVERLRDLDPASRAVTTLPPPLARRVRHVLTENRRVQEAVEALEHADPVHLGALLDASHRSLRDDYQVSTDEIEFLVDRLRAEEGVHGARMTGGGFGGAVLAITRPGAGREIATRASAAYERQTGRTARVVTPLEGDRAARV
jgi:galactokinase